MAVGLVDQGRVAAGAVSAAVVSVAVSAAVVSTAAAVVSTAAAVVSTAAAEDQCHHLPALILGFFGGKKQVRPGKLLPYGPGFKNRLMFPDVKV